MSLLFCLGLLFPYVLLAVVLTHVLGCCCFHPRFVGWGAQIRFGSSLIPHVLARSPCSGTVQVAQPLHCGIVRAIGRFFLVLGLWIAAIIHCEFVATEVP